MITGSIVELFENSGVPYVVDGQHKHARKGWVNVDCPSCGPMTGKFHLGFKLATCRFNCWQCGKLPFVDVILALIPGMDPVQARRLGIKLYQGRNLESITGYQIQPSGKLVIPDGIDRLSQYHRRYLEDRKFDPDEIAEVWGVKGIGIEDRLSWRLWIPIEYNQATVSWTTRTIQKGDSVLRYVSAKPQEEVFYHKSLLYGEDLVRNNTVIVVEGPTDVWRIGPGAVATFGLSWTEEQLLRIATYQTRVICFDNTDSAQRTARKLANELLPLSGETYTVRLDADDPGSATKREVKDLRRQFLGE